MRTMHTVPTMRRRLTILSRLHRLSLLEHIHLQDADGYADRHVGGNVGCHAGFRAPGELANKPRLVLELRDNVGIPASMCMLEAAELAE